MANLVACEFAEQAGEAWDLYGVAREQAGSFTIYYRLEPNELNRARREGVALLAIGAESIDGLMVPKRLLLYDWTPGKGSLPPD